MEINKETGKCSPQTGGKATTKKEDKKRLLKTINMCKGLKETKATTVQRIKRRHDDSVPSNSAYQ